MFNGIIKNTGRISKIYKKNNNCVLEISSNMTFKKNEIGSSISCSGVCLTLEKYKKKIMQFYLSKETLNRTIFNYSKIGDIVNLEKSLRYGDRLSGHFAQGHVDTVSSVKKIDYVGKSWLINFDISKKYLNYLVSKGSITINGVSLTISKVLKGGFQISIIPKTLKFTNFTTLKIKDFVNVEIDIFGKYIKHFIK